MSDRPAFFSLFSFQLHALIIGIVYTLALPLYANSILFNEVEVNGQTYYFVGLSPVNRTNPRSYGDWLATGQNGPDPRQFPVNMETDSTELPGLQKILYEGGFFLDSPDMQRFLAESGTSWKPFQGNPLENTETLKAYQRHMVDLFYEFAEFYKMETYEKTKAIPKTLSSIYPPVVQSEMPDNQLIVLVLTKDKNFAGLFSLSLPTLNAPLLASQKILKALQQNGIADTETQLPLLANPDEITELEKLGFVNSFGRRSRFLGEWRSITGELGSLVGIREFSKDLFGWAVYALEIMSNSTSWHDLTSRHFINNGAPIPERMRDSNLSTNIGGYLAVCKKNRFRIFKQMAWEKVYEVGDVVFATLSRKNFLKIYLPSFGNGHSLNYSRGIAPQTRKAHLFNQTSFGPISPLNDRDIEMEPIPLDVVAQDIQSSYHAAKNTGFVFSSQRASNLRCQAVFR